jgi:hypothetical protein
MFWDANGVKFLFETQRKACKNLHWYATNYNPIKIEIGAPCIVFSCNQIAINCHK